LHWYDYWPGEPQAEIYRIVVRRSASEPRYYVDASVSRLDGATSAARISVAHAGQVIASPSFPSEARLGGSQTFSLSFEPSGEDDHTVTVELTEAGSGDWFEEVSLTKPLDGPGPWEFYHDEGADPGNGGGGPRIDYPISAAEERRGFPLPYVLAS